MLVPWSVGSSLRMYSVLPGESVHQHCKVQLIKKRNNIWPQRTVRGNLIYRKTLCTECGSPRVSITIRCRQVDQTIMWQGSCRLSCLSSSQESFSVLGFPQIMPRLGSAPILRAWCAPNLREDPHSAATGRPRVDATTDERLWRAAGAPVAPQVLEHCLCTVFCRSLRWTSCCGGTRPGTGFNRNGAFYRCVWNTLRLFFILLIINALLSNSPSGVNNSNEDNSNSEYGIPTPSTKKRIYA
nr:hypothetical protein CFP56_73513 [Quercus suber]